MFQNIRRWKERKQQAHNQQKAHIYERGKVKVSRKKWHWKKIPNLVACKTIIELVHKTDSILKEYFLQISKRYIST